jgi:hypothetical protein
LAMGPPKCRPRTVAVVRSSAPSAPVIRRESAGEGGPVAGELDEHGRDGDSGCAADEADVELSPDHVDSHASGVVSRPKPVRP